MAYQDYYATIAETLQKGYLATWKWLPTRFRKTLCKIDMTLAVFQIAASFLTSRDVINTVTSTYLDTFKLYRVVLLQGNEYCTILYITGIPIWTAL